jgi:hypothetical protein
MSGKVTSSKGKNRLRRNLRAWINSRLHGQFRYGTITDF